MAIRRRHAVADDLAKCGMTPRRGDDADRWRSPRSATDASLRDEMATRAAEAWYPVTLAEIRRRLRGIGYVLDHSLDCRTTARIMMGLGAGRTYPCLTTGISEVDTGRSAFHIEARRDADFHALQTLRGDRGLYAIVNGAILDI